MSKKKLPLLTRRQRRTGHITNSNEGYCERAVAIVLFSLNFFGRCRIINNDLRINEDIRAREVRVVNADGEQLGIMPLREALQLAAEQDLDLVEVAPLAKPPVCRIMNYGKYRYEQSRREREARKKQKIIEIKEIRMTPKIEDHDFEVKAKAAKKFLQDGDKVKVMVRFRGREIVHAELGRVRMMQLYEAVREYANLEREPKIEGKNMIMILSAKENKENKEQKADKVEKEQEA